MVLADGHVFCDIAAGVYALHNTSSDIYRNHRGHHHPGRRQEEWIGLNVMVTDEIDMGYESALKRLINNDNKMAVRTILHEGGEDIIYVGMTNAELETVMTNMLIAKVLSPTEERAFEKFSLARNRYIMFKRSVSDVTGRMVRDFDLDGR